MKVYFNNSCKICKTEIDLYKKEIIEDKTNPEKNNSYEFRNVDIFKASDMMVDSLTQLIAKKRDKDENKNLMN